MPDPPDADWRAALRARGYRLTPQRELILGAVEELGHATPDEVLAKVRERASSVNNSTVYRALEVLEELGLVRHTHLSDRSPTYHSTSGHQHFHLVCRNCGRVISVDTDVAATFSRGLTDEHGFVADIGHLTVFGRCQECPPEVVEEGAPVVEDGAPPVVEEGALAPVSKPLPPVVEEGALAPVSKPPHPTGDR